MNQEEVLARVQRVVAKELVVTEDKVLMSTRFTDDLKADSLDLVELVMAIEEEFAPELQAAGKDGISDEEAEKLVSVQDVVSYILEAAPG